MFDIGADELLLTAVVAIVVIGPKDLPRALRTVGRWVGRMRRMSNAFRAGIENVIREAEIEEMEREWRERNAAIMAAHPATGPDEDAAAAALAAQGQMKPQMHGPPALDGPAADPAAPATPGASATAGSAAQGPQPTPSAER